MISRFAAIVASLLQVPPRLWLMKHAKRREEFQLENRGNTFHYFLSRFLFVYFACFVG